MEKKEEVLLKVIEWILDASNRNQVREFIRCEYPESKLTDVDCDALIEEAMELFAKNVSLEEKLVISNHRNLYEDIYKYFISIDHADGANKVLKNKERLTGLVSGNRTVINKKTNININRNITYDLSKLTEVEQTRLKHLWEKGNNIESPLLEW